MKTLLLALIAVFTASISMASPLDDFRSNGQVGYGLDLDFTMQNELNSAISAQSLELDKRMDAGVAGSAALAMLPEGDGVLAVGVAGHSSGRALAVGYSKKLAEKYFTRLGLAYNSEKEVTVGGGVGYKF